MAKNVNNYFLTYGYFKFKFILNHSGIFVSNKNIAESFRCSMPKRYSSHCKTVANYMNSKKCLQLISNFVPKKYFIIKKHPTYYTFVVDDDVARDIVHAMKKYLKGKTPVAEVSPGLGLLTRHIMLAGVQNLLLFDSRIITLPPLQQIMVDNPASVKVIPRLLYDLPVILLQDQKDGGNRFETLFKDVPRRDWTDDPAIKIIGFLHKSYFVRYLAKSICFDGKITKLGRMECFFLMDNMLHKHLVQPKGWGRLQNRVLFQTFFDFEILGEFPRIALLPWDKGKGIPIEDRVVHLVRILAKPNLLQEFPDDQLKAFWFFVHVLTRSKKSFVIRLFEDWVPGSGLRLIQAGITVMLTVEECSSEEILMLFRIFSSLPEFQHLRFVEIQEAALLLDADAEEDETEKDLIAEITESQHE